jgi:hypothetical protein
MKMNSLEAFKATAIEKTIEKLKKEKPGNPEWWYMQHVNVPVYSFQDKNCAIKTVNDFLVFSGYNPEKPDHTLRFVKNPITGESDNTPVLCCHIIVPVNNLRLHISIDSDPRYAWPKWAVDSYKKHLKNNEMYLSINSFDDFINQFEKINE